MDNQSLVRLDITTVIRTIKTGKQNNNNITETDKPVARIHDRNYDSNNTGNNSNSRK